VISDRSEFWERERHRWPNHELSRFVAAGGIRWHVQQSGTGPPLLLVHGTGASTHSWRDLWPLLAERYTVIAADLPGHAFTASAPAARCSLRGMSQALATLLATLDVAPTYCIGHSAGAAILCRMALDRHIAPRQIVSINGAFLPLGGAAGVLFAPIAKLFAANTLVPRLISWRGGDAAAVERVIAGTGSRLDRVGIDLYARLVREPCHIAGALAMMGNWNLQHFEQELAHLATPLHLLVGARDRAVPASQALRIRQRLPQTQVTELAGLGHLAHEEAPREVGPVLLRTLAAC
jgi:magnesium chelatase accessory protein